MKRALAILFLLLILTACSNSKPAIVKVDTPPENVAEEPELIEEITDDEEVDEFIEFKLNDEVLRVNLEKIPILSAYLHGVENKQAVIEMMDIQHIVNQDGNDIYLLEFSCHEDECSYLLLDQNSENTGILVADFASFENDVLSPNESKLLLKFNRKSTDQDYSLSNIVIIELKEWEVLPLENETININLFDYNSPIESASWVDENKVSISIPDSFFSNFEIEAIDHNELVYIVGKQ